MGMSFREFLEVESAENALEQAIAIALKLMASLNPHEAVFQAAHEIAQKTGVQVDPAEIMNTIRRNPVKYKPEGVFQWNYTMGKIPQTDKMQPWTTGYLKTR